MKSSVFFTFLLLATLALSSCATLEINLVDQNSPQGSSTSDQEPVPSITPDRSIGTLTVSSTAEEVRIRMLRSHMRWGTFWGDAQQIDYSSGEALTRRLQIWVNQLGPRYRVLTGPIDGQPTFLVVADGFTQIGMDVRSGSINTAAINPSIRDPFLPPDAISDTITPHPIAGQLGTPLADMLFPTALAQRAGTVTPLGLERVAGREALMVDWSPVGMPRVDRFWVDTQTGIILRWQNYGKGGGDNLQMDMFFNIVTVDASFPDSLFDVAQVAVPEFASDFTGVSQPQAAHKPTPAIGETDPIGTLYFNIPDQGRPVLYSLPASCLRDQFECPQPYTVPGYPNTRFEMRSLAWSPDGNKALLPTYVSRADGATPMALYLYTFDMQDWKALDEFDSIGDIFWSPDGSRAAFVALRQSRLDVYTVQADGSQIVNRTADLISSATQVGLYGWDNSGVLLVSTESTPRRIDLYRLTLDGGRLDRVNDATNWRPLVVVAPGNGFGVIATSEGDAGFSIWLVDRAFQPLRKLAGFPNASFWHAVWLENPSRLLFDVRTGNGESFSSSLYSILPDGSGLQLIAQMAEISWISPLPGGEYVLLLAAEPGDSLFRLYSVNLATSEKRLVVAPGVPLTSSWAAPSFQPNRTP